MKNKHHPKSNSTFLSGLTLAAFPCPRKIRHALNQGAATRLLETFATSPAFIATTFGGINDQRMGARECILSFFAFYLTPYTQYRAKDFDAFLNEAMRQINKLSLPERRNLETQFYRTMKAAKDIFGQNAFRKQYEGGQRRAPINKALFEAWSVNLAYLDDLDIGLLVARKNAVNEEFQLLLTYDRDFQSSISQATGNISKVLTRFASVRELIKTVLE